MSLMSLMGLMSLMSLMRVGVKVIRHIGCKNKRSLSHTFSRHGKMRASFLLLIWLNDKVHFRAPFLAMAKLKLVSLCSFGLTKRFFLTI